MGPQPYIGFKQINLWRLLSTYYIKCSTWSPNISSQLGKQLRKILLAVQTCERTMGHHKWASVSRELISINTLGTMSGTLMRGWEEQDTDSTTESRRGASFPWHLAPFWGAALTSAKLRTTLGKMTGSERGKSLPPNKARWQKLKKCQLYQCATRCQGALVTDATEMQIDSEYRDGMQESGNRKLSTAGTDTL